jgi:hypothetical protein
MKLIRISILAVLFAITLVSCKKDEDALGKEDLEIAEDNSLTESLYEASYEAADDASRNDENVRNESGTSLTDCAVVTYDSTNGKKRLIVDFGTDSCVGADGRIRKGKVFIEFNGRYLTKGSTATVTFENHYINGYKIEGTKVISNLGNNSQNQPQWNVKITNGVITSPAGKVYKHYSDRTRTQVGGNNTIFNIFDDVYEITGNGGGTTNSGLNYTYNVDKPLNINILCRWVKSGVLSITPEGKTSRVIDYGNGLCDANATLTVGDNTYDFLMR